MSVSGWQKGKAELDTEDLKVEQEMEERFKLESEQNTKWEDNSYFLSTY